MHFKSFLSEISFSYQKFPRKPTIKRIQFCQSSLLNTFQHIASQIKYSVEIIYLNGKNVLKKHKKTLKISKMKFLIICIIATCLSFGSTKSIRAKFDEAVYASFELALVSHGDLPSYSKCVVDILRAGNTAKELRKVKNYFNLKALERNLQTKYDAAHCQCCCCCRKQGGIIPRIKIRIQFIFVFLYN